MGEELVEWTASKSKKEFHCHKKLELLLLQKKSIMITSALKGITTTFKPQSQKVPQGHLI